MAVVAVVGIGFCSAVDKIIRDCWMHYFKSFIASEISNGLFVTEPSSISHFKHEREWGNVSSFINM